MSENELRAAMKAVFGAGYLEWMVKGVKQRQTPMDTEGRFMSWSDWLVNKLTDPAFVAACQAHVERAPA